MSRKTFRKIFGALLIILSLVVASLPTSESDATESVKQDFEISGTTLLKYTGTATTVSVPDSVKEIAAEAFSDCTSMTSIKLPQGLEKIGYAAFSGCRSLTAVSIPDSVKEIDSAAFCNCIALDKFSLGKDTYSLGTGIFAGCNRLSSISDNDSIRCVDGVLYDKKYETLIEVLPNSQVKRDVSSNDYVLRTSYDMPDTVTKIYPYAFYGCGNINSISFSSNLTEIPAYSFSYCYGLKNLKIPYAVDLIDTKAFENCVNLEKVEMSSLVSFIHKTAFDGCYKLKIEAPVDSYAYNWFLNFETDNVTIVENEDNSETGSNGNTEKPENPPIDGLIGETVIVGRQAMFFIDSTSFTVHGNKSDFTQTIQGMENILQAETNGKGLSLPKFTVLGDTISGRAFYADNSLSDYEINDDIKSIGDFAFARTPISSIAIPDGVTHIGYGAFYHCNNLSTISVPLSVTDIEPSAFKNTRMLDNWFLYGDSNFLIMGDNILVAYKGNSSKVTVPDNVKTIGPEAFMGHTELMEITIPDSVTRICEDAFNGCSNLRNIIGGMNLEKIEDRSFYGCPLNTVRVVDSVKEIGLGAFDQSESSLSDAYKAVVFLGDTLPTVSYNKTASRLTNKDYRVDAFNSIKVAIVNSESVDRVNTVLDRNLSGFSGLICLIATENNEYFNGTLKVIDCTLTKEEANEFDIADTVYIYGKGYNFIKDELDSVLAMAKDGAFYGDEEIEETVHFTGSDTDYILTAEVKDNVDEHLREAYNRIYGDTIPGNFTSVYIGLRDKANEVALTKFGKQKLKVKLDLPDNMPTNNLHVVCIDEDNQLEDLPFSIVNDDDSLKISFDISHTGEYGLYAFNSTAVSLFDLDDSPDTGDYIHPKWYMALALLSIGMILILYRKKSVF